MNDFIKKIILERTKVVKQGETDVLDLVKLGLTSIPTEVFECENVRELLLNSDSVVNKQSIELSEEYWWEVSFDNNEISAIPDKIAKLKNLEILNLNQNYVKEISPKIGDLKNLKELHLRNNLLTEIPKEIGNLTNLEILDLSFNNISEIPEKIYNLKNLRVLNLCSNNLKNLPGGIEKLQNLEIFDISNFDKNNVFSDTIERFNLTTNYFKALPTEMASLSKLTEFNYEFALAAFLDEIISCGLEAYPYGLGNDEESKAGSKH